MANSLQEQLIRAGLADQAQAKPAQPKRKPKPKARPKPKVAQRAKAGKPATQSRPRTPEEQALEQERRELRAMEQQRKREEKQAQQAQQDARAKQQRREQVRAFLLENQQNDRNGELPFNFAADNRIRRLYVTEAQRSRVQAGELLVAVLGKRDFLIERALHEQVQALDPELFVFDATAQQNNAGDEDDPYKDYAVPDDLMW